MDFDFTINWPLLVLRNLPQNKRDGVMFLDSLKAARKGNELIYADFLTKVATVREDLTYNSQWMVLERMLNRYFLQADQWATEVANPQADQVTGSTLGGGIYITNANNLLPTSYLFNSSEGQVPMYIYDQSEGQPPVYIYDQAEFSGQYDFVIMVPNWWLWVQGYLLSDFEPMCRKRVDMFRAAGKRYILQAY
jgi:hypothetical protein